MSEYADKYNKPEIKERVEKVLSDPVRIDKSQKIDASGYAVPDALNNSEKTGEQPKPRKFKKGGRVEGKEAHHHAGRKSRDMGGQAALQQLRPQVPSGGLYGNGFSPTHAGIEASAAGIKKGGAVKKRACGGEIQRANGQSKAGFRLAGQDKMPANLGGPTKGEPEGDTDVTGVRITGGRKARAEGGFAQTQNDFAAKNNLPAPSQSQMRQNMKVRIGQIERDRRASGKGEDGKYPYHPELDSLKKQMRAHRAEGGRTKGKTNINIIIGGPKEQAPPMIPPPPSAMPPGRPPLPPGAMGAMQPPGAMGGAGPGAMPPQIPAGLGPK